MTILAKIKFSEATHRPTINGENIIDGKKIVFFSENWLHIEFKEYTKSMFSVFTTSSEKILYQNEEYEVIMEFLIGNKIKEYVNLFVGQEFEGGYASRLFLKGKILEIIESERRPLSPI